MLLRKALEVSDSPEFALLLLTWNGLPRAGACGHPWVVLQATGAGALSWESFGAIFLCIMLVPYLRCVLFAQLLKNLIIILERKHWTSNVTLQVSYSYFYYNGGVALAKMLHAVLSQRFKGTAVLVICCKMYKH